MGAVAGPSPQQKVDGLGRVPSCTAAVPAQQVEPFIKNNKKGRSWL